MAPPPAAAASPESAAAAAAAAGGGGDGAPRRTGAGRSDRTVSRKAVPRAEAGERPRPWAAGARKEEPSPEGQVEADMPGEVGQRGAEAARARAPAEGPVASIACLLFSGALRGLGYRAGGRLPPERQKESRIVFVHLAGVLRGIIHGGQAGGVVGDRRAVRRDGIELVAAGILQLLAVPVRGAGGAEGKDKRDAGPEVVNQSTGDLMITVQGQEKGRPLFLQAL